MFELHIMLTAGTAMIGLLEAQAPRCLRRPIAILLSYSAAARPEADAGCASRSGDRP